MRLTAPLLQRLRLHCICSSSLLYPVRCDVSRARAPRPAPPINPCRTHIKSALAPASSLLAGFFHAALRRFFLNHEGHPCTFTDRAGQVPLEVRGHLANISCEQSDKVAPASVCLRHAYPSFFELNVLPRLPTTMLDIRPVGTRSAAANSPNTQQFAANRGAFSHRFLRGLRVHARVVCGGDVFELG